MAKYIIFLIFALFPVAFAQGADHYMDHLDVLKNLTDEGSNKISESLNIINAVPEYYQSMIAERFECLQWECVIQQECMNKSTANTVIKGMLTNKMFKSFQCISKGSFEASEKLNEACARIPQESGAVLKKGIDSVLQFRLLLPGFNKYVQDLYRKKKEELMKANKEETKKKILREVENQMKNLNTILEKIKTYVKQSEVTFFEVYVNFVFATENALRNIVRNGTKKISECVN